MKTILHITKGKYGGLDFISKDIFEYLKLHFEQKIFYFYDDGDHIYKDFQKEKISIVEYKEEVMFANFINRFKDFYDADVIHVHHTKFWILFSPLIFFSKKVIFSFHMSFGSGVKKNVLEKFTIRLIVSYCTLFSSKLIFLTDGQKREILKHSFFGRLLEKKSIVIPNFIKPEHILNFKHASDFTVLYVGRYTFTKGFEDFLSLVKKTPEVNFLCLGDSDFKPHLPNLTNYGIVEHSTINTYYDKATIFFLPSYTEAFPLTILEAMARGLVVVISDLPGMKDIVKERNGYLFETGDVLKMKEILMFLKKNPTMIKKISENNLNDVSKFSSDLILKRYLHVY
ncbi:MAG: glycosyltransferase family 4 protein [Minisyncoccia bacterium]|jgi:glycosyltransferase involved in cell wall biosynthesis